jgi:hypothetical protein
MWRKRSDMEARKSLKYLKLAFSIGLNPGETSTQGGDETYHIIVEVDQVLDHWDTVGEARRA